jgi:arginase
MNVNLIGVPIHLGSDIEGVNLGPEKLREKDIISTIKRNSHNIYDLGNIYVKKVQDEDKFSSHKKMKYIDTIVDVNTNLAHQVYSSLTSGSFPFVIGGDHSLGLGSLAGASKYFTDIAVIWIDAHGDINTYETTPSGNVHGMPLAAAMGLGYAKLINLYYEGAKVKSKNVYIIGARDLDEGELKLIQELHLNVWTTSDIRQKGVETVIKEVLKTLKDKNTKNVHLSFDIDCLDKSLVPGTGTPVSEGIEVFEAKYILETLTSSGLVKSMDFVELNTLLDKEDSTAEIAIELIDHAFKNLR